LVIFGSQEFKKMAEYFYLESEKKTKYGVEFLNTCCSVLSLGMCWVSSESRCNVL